MNDIYLSDTRFNTIDMSKLKDAYKKFSGALSKEENDKFEMFQRKNRELLSSLISHTCELVTANAKYEYEYASPKWYKSVLFKILSTIVVVTLILSISNDIKSTVVASTILILLGISSSVDDVWKKTALTNLILNKTTESNRIFHKLMGNGVSQEVIGTMIYKSEDVKNAKFDIRYIKNENVIPSDSELESLKKEDEFDKKLYLKLQLILNLELMRFITRSDIFTKNDALFKEVTKNYMYGEPWINYILDEME